MLARVRSPHLGESTASYCDSHAPTDAPSRARWVARSRLGILYRTPLVLDYRLVVATKTEQPTASPRKAIVKRRRSRPDAAEIAAIRRHIEHALTDGSVPARKALLQALVHEIRVEGRDRVVPWFRVPGGADPKVRAPARSAPPAGNRADGKRPNLRFHGEY